MKEARTVRVIELKETKQNPESEITQYWDFEGNLLFETNKKNSRVVSEMEFILDAIIPL